ncbi:MAG: YebC/PmpR family DNA-binding transcriptional regulator, partial [Cyanobacteria bacterium]|nr:YebC/PmpR family DNA-binding transcriptional regulator [Cyanobacteriota bacterium]
SVEPEDHALVICPPDKLLIVKTAVSSAGHKVRSAEVNMDPMSTVEVSDRDIAKQLFKLLDQLENHDDVQRVFANFDISDDWMQDIGDN